MTSHLAFYSAGVKEAMASWSISVYGHSRQGQPFEFLPAYEGEPLATQAVYSSRDKHTFEDRTRQRWERDWQRGPSWRKNHMDGVRNDLTARPRDINLSKLKWSVKEKHWHSSRKDQQPERPCRHPMLRWTPIRGKMNKLNLDKYKTYL